MWSDQGALIFFPVLAQDMSSLPSVVAAGEIACEECVDVAVATVIAEKS
jgi:hypothetical protein